MKRLCRCGHDKAEHRGTLTSWHGRLVSRSACVAETTVARIGNSYAERVGGDRCERWDPSWCKTLRAVFSPGLPTQPTDAPDASEAAHG